MDLNTTLSPIQGDPGLIPDNVNKIMIDLIYFFNLTNGLSQSPIAFRMSLYAGFQGRPKDMTIQECRSLPFGAKLSVKHLSFELYNHILLWPPKFFWGNAGR